MASRVRQSRERNSPVRFNSSGVMSGILLADISSPSGGKFFRVGAFELKTEPRPRWVEAQLTLH